LNAKIAILLVLTLCAFALAVTTTFNCATARLYAFSNSVTVHDDQPLQPLGDPVDGGGDIPH